MFAKIRKVITRVRNAFSQTTAASATTERAQHHEAPYRAAPESWRPEQQTPRQPIGTPWMERQEGDGPHSEGPRTMHGDTRDPSLTRHGYKPH
jgi:hypothetical protein